MVFRWYSVGGVVAVAGLLAFFAGRELGARPASSTTSTTTTSTTAARTEGQAPAATPPADSDRQPSTRAEALPALASVLASSSAAAGGSGAMTSSIQVAEETPAQREERHREITKVVTATLGEVSPQKLAALLQLNDESVDVQQKQQAAFTSGDLSHDDYMAQQHQAILVMLEELHETVTDDEYRKLTGLQPGVDPYEYSRTGIGGAGTPPPAPKVDEGSSGSAKGR